MPLTVDFKDVLDAADLMRRADRSLSAAMRRAANREVAPLLRDYIRAKATMPQDRRIVAAARIRSGNNPAVVVGGTGRFAGGASVNMMVRVQEFGGARNKVRQHRMTHRISGKTYMVRRHTARQIPHRTPKGRMIYPAVAAAAPVLVHMWLQAIMDAYEEGTTA